MTAKEARFKLRVRQHCLAVCLAAKNIEGANKHRREIARLKKAAARLVA